MSAILVQNNITNLYYFNNKMDSNCPVSPSESPSTLNSEPIRSNKYSAPFLFNSRHYLRSLRLFSAPSIPDPKGLSEETQNLLQSICTKFSFTDQTLALGVHFFQTLRHLNSHEKFWASSCLIIAGKACELDKNVPYLNRYQRYADKSFTQSDYENAERMICEALNFDLQITTFVPFLDYYLSKGVISPSQHLEALPDLVELESAAKAKEFILKGVFSKYEPELLALSIIKQIRVKNNLTPWTAELEKLCGRKENEIPEYVCHQPAMKELKEVTHSQNMNTDPLKDKNILKVLDKGSSSKKKYQYKPHFSSIAKNSLKENSFSASKFVLQSRKSSQPFVENFSTLNTQLVKRR